MCPVLFIIDLQVGRGRVRKPWDHVFKLTLGSKVIVPSSP